MNNQGGQHVSNPAMMFQAQQQQQHQQFNPNAINGLGGPNGAGGLSMMQAQQLQHMYKYGQSNSGNNSFNPQMMQAAFNHAQQQAGGQVGGNAPMGVNPQALLNNQSAMNANMGMNGMSLNPQQMLLQQQQQHQKAQQYRLSNPNAGGSSMPSGINPAQLLAQQSSGGGMSGMGVNRMNGGMGGMNMNGMGGINPQNLTMSVNAVAGSQSATSPQSPHSQSSMANPSMMSSSHSSSVSAAPAQTGNPQSIMPTFDPSQVQYLMGLSGEERSKEAQRLLATRFAAQNQQQNQQGMDGMNGMSFTVPMSGSSGMQTMGGQGGNGMNMQGQGMNMNMQNMGGMNGMQSIGGMQNFSAQQLSRMHAIQAQHALNQLGQSQGQQQGFERPSSSASHLSQGAGPPQQASPTQQHAFLHQGLTQGHSPTRSQTPQMQHQAQMQGHPHHSSQQQHQQHPQLQAQMMPPPSSIPPRPPTTQPSPAPRPGAASGMHGVPQHHQQHQQMQQMQQQQQYMRGHAQSPRPGTAGGGAMPSPRVNTHSLQPGQQPQGQGQQSHMQVTSPQAPVPIPIQPRPPVASQLGTSPAPPQRPGTSQSMRALTPSNTRAITPSQVMSRPGTASGYPQQMQAQPQGHPQHSQQSQQSPTQGQPQTVQMQHQAHTPTTLTPTSATYPPIAPIPVPGSPTRGAKRKAGTPGPSSTGTPAPPQQGQSHMQGQVPPQQHGQTQTQQLSQAQMLAQMQGRMPSGMGGGPGMNMTGNASAASGMTPAQLASMRMSAGMNNANMMAGLMGGAGGGMMGPPVLPRSQSLPQVDMSLPGMNGINGMGMNGMPVQSISRQASSGDLRDIASAATSPTAANVAGLSINAGLNQAMAMGTGPGGINSMSVPSASSMMMSLSSSPNPAMLGAGASMPSMDSLLIAPSTPRQPSQPPASGSPFLQANMGMATEKKISGQGLLVNAAPLGRMSSDVSSNAAGPSAMAPSSGDTAVAAASTAAPSVSSAPTVIPQLPPLPANVSLNPKTTRVSVVPLIDSENLIPQLAPDEIANVQKWMQVDKEYEGMYKKMRDRMTEEVRDVVVKTRPWWEKDPLADARGNRRRRDKFEIIGMKGGKDERSRRKLGKREGFKLPRTVDPEGASRPEQLVPIRLEFDVEHHKMRDTFLWNLNDPIITPEIFAQSVVDDYSLAPSYHAVITKTIQDQLSDFKSHSTFFGEDGIPNSPVEDVSVKGSFDDEDAVWWDAWRQNAQKDVSYKKVSGREEAHSRKRRKIVKDEVVDHAEIPPAVEKDQPMSVDDFEEDDSKALEEMRILIKLDIIVGPLKLEDQFEWDLDSLDPSPERFAEVYAKELGLGGEFRTSIAHSIREQAQIYQKSLFLVGHPSDGTMLQDDDLRMSLLPSLHTGARSMDQVGAFTPILSYLSDSEIERNEKEREKELNRRRRKTTRGRRGVALPDREPPKTFRTPAIGFPEVDAATLAAVNAAAAPTSRRAAAAAASLTIANMVASENGTAPITQNIPIPAAPSAPVVLKEKKPKGLFKAPSYSPTVLRPRAHVVAPIASTAADPSTVPPPSENDMPVSTGAPESRGARVVFSAKRVKELEREAKEREYVDGQHANYIDGVWHCSNCGCPESIAIGRRKGPLGDKSQCGVCGKFWHRHRRPRPVQYNSDLEYHLGLKRQEEQARIAASRKKRPQANNAIEASSSKAPTVEPETPMKPKSEVWVEIPSFIPGPPEPSTASGDVERAASPISTASSISEAPLAQAVKTNGIGHSAQSAPASTTVDSPPASTEAPATPNPGPPPTPASAPPPARPPPRFKRGTMPPWLSQAMAEMQERYPDDRFEAILRVTTGVAVWRIKCLDCPGKLYTPGPGETLTNYEVHIGNRLHRLKVTNRLEGDAQP